MPQSRLSFRNYGLADYKSLLIDYYGIELTCPDEGRDLRATGPEQSHLPQV